ncbi:MAG: SipW-dependent-type signal peptide-containing protein [Clostridiales bacterium]|nr:SipW-dependent-type signal peptide-containing protein [Clostridiales bacterium]
MKKKIIVSAIAVILVASLAIGGTIMYFTAETPTAKNTVTFGDLKIKLQEKGGKLKEAADGAVEIGEKKYEYVDDDDYIEDWADIDDDIEGITFTNVVPNGKLIKEPRVVHDGGVDAYLRVKAELKVYSIGENGGKTLVEDLSVPNVPGSDPSTSLNTLVSRLIAGLTMNQAAWEFVDPAPANDLVGFYYYVVGDWDTATPTPLKLLTSASSGNTTPEIFSVVNIPNYTNAEATFLAGYEIVLELTAQAVQAEFNGTAGVTDKALWNDYFKNETFK